MASSISVNQLLGVRNRNLTTFFYVLGKTGRLKVPEARMNDLHQVEGVNYRTTTAETAPKSRLISVVLCIEPLNDRLNDLGDAPDDRIRGEFLILDIPSGVG